ncbi:MAG: hypothetical protein MJ097_07890 [Dorea sp.]|nr:hypothetical protein [Dorea sp.]
MSEMTITQFEEKLKDLVKLETLLAEQEVLLKVFRKYLPQAVRPVPFKNVATLGMATLTGTWAILDLFAFMSGHKQVGIICTVFTIALGLFFLRMKLREKTITENKIAEFEEYMEKHAEVIKIDDTAQRLKRTLEQIYEAVGVYPRYREMNAVCAILGYLESGRTTMLTGEASPYKIYDAELSKNNIEDVKKMVAPPIDDVELIADYLKKVNAELDEIEDKYL